MNLPPISMAENNIRLSFIVPFYNVEQYIEECIRSIYNQDIAEEEYEVICIDDCSPDNSRSIVEKLQQEYSTLKLYTCPENLKQGGARNIGIENAKGKYIWFVDSDDAIEPKCLKKLLETAEQDELEILDFDFKTDNKQGFRKGDIGYEMGPCTGEEYVFDPRVKWDWKCCSVWGEIIKKDLITNNNLCFAEHVQYEDCDFAILLYYHAQKVKHIPNKVYYYRNVDNSTTHNQISYSQIEYRIALIERYNSILTTTKPSIKWSNGITTLIQDICNEILDILPLLTHEYKKMYYKKDCKRLCETKNYISIKKYLRLRYSIAYRLL